MAEILVNTATENDQSDPRVTVLVNGGFVVTWQDASEGDGGATGDTSDLAVKAQIFTAAGVPVGAEILVNTATDGDQEAPEITALSNGGFVVTWADASGGVGGATGDASGLAVKAQIFTAAGVPVGGEILVNTATDGDQETPQITALSNGGFVVTWQDSLNTTSQAVKAQVFTAAGAAVGGEILVSTQYALQVTALSGGAFVVTWLDNTGDFATRQEVRARVYTAAGAPASGEIFVNAATEQDQITPQVTALSNGGFVVTWLDFSGGVGGAGGDTSAAVKAQVFTAAGATVGGEIRVNTATELAQDSPQITALSGGGFVVTWSDHSAGVGGATGDTSEKAIKAQVFTAAGVPVGGEILVNTTTTTGTQEDSQIAALSNGGFVVTWEDLGGEGDPHAIRAQVFTAAGAAVGDEILVDTDTANNTHPPLVAALGDDSFVVTWQDENSDTGEATGDTSDLAIKAQVFGLSVNDAPVLDLDANDSSGATAANYTTAFTENGAAVAIGDSDTSVADTDDTNMESATITIANAQAGDSLAVGNAAALAALGISVQSATATSIVLTGSASLANYESAIELIVFSNSSETPGTSARDITVVVNDGSSDSNTAHTTIAINAVNDAPVITSNGGDAAASIAVAENSTAVTTVTATDADGPSLAFSIVGGSDAAMFQVDAATGALTFVDAPDFEAPGDADSNNSYVVQVRASDGSSTDTQTITVDVSDTNDPPPPSGLPRNDFNGDGKGDILWQNINGTPAVWLMDGFDVLTIGPVLYNPGPTWHATEAADFDGDGKADILWQNADGTPAVWLMDGVDVLTIGPALYNSGPTWHATEAADFNGDGKADILWQNDNGAPAVWLMDGIDVLTTGPVLSNPGPTWHEMAAADFNGDGKADILWQNDSGAASVWLMDGTGAAAVGPVLSNPGPTWHVEEAADFNGDGKADILWQNDNGMAAVWLMDGTGVATYGDVLESPDPAWRVKDASDYDGDSRADILWQNNNGTTAVWLMDGTNAVTFGPVLDPGPGWHVI